ncbi:MAG: Sugar phosphatase YidA [Anaerolineae bacterium]|nr:Sugar phosphatase YidA [Anaerolineae bacterium]
MPIKLLALDLDGTILANMSTISLPVRRALAAAQQQGVRVTLATGRDFIAAKPYIDLLAITEPVICHQGAATCRPDTGDIIAGQPIPLPLAGQLAQLARAHQLALNFYVGHNAYAEHITPQSQQLYQKMGVPQSKIDDFAAVLTTAPTKGLIIHPANDVERIVRLLRDAVSPHVSVVPSLDVHIELVAAGVSKGSALAALAGQMNIAQSEVMAMGDHNNDIEMLEWAGLGVAMGDGTAAARAAANVVAPPLAADGAAWAINKFILGQN